ncbi:Nuclear envelope morphology protein [Lachnellula suecica]|uniref:Nuclear envelope morphology protein n=1 Tax=Lachnellula suecica TaxID=602035 RepID=A0A8T9C7E9_9HELO|nr:Nuclear envelope morphology protein [Lachnellula suecica]
MNSLNILSARVSPPQTPAPSRSNSYGNLLASMEGSGSRRNSRENTSDEKSESLDGVEEAEDEKAVHEETPLLDKEVDETSAPQPTGWHKVPKRISGALIESIRWMLSTLAAPGVYLIACLYDERGTFAPFTQLRKLGSGFGSPRRISASQAAEDSFDSERISGEPNKGRNTNERRGSNRRSKALSSNSSSSGMSSESESDRDRALSEEDKAASSTRHTRSKSDEIAPARRSIRIKLHNEDNLRQRKHRRAQSASTQSNGSGAVGEISPATLKSSTSSASSLLMTKYPRAPVPPRPLIPARQPSYTIPDPPSGRLIQKTLILDLDETLIHSMAKGGRTSSGHMVEVKLNNLVSADGSSTLGPQHPILYYVHKRPHCDDFLRRICKWYKLVIFTASVQEYADPVIDLLEVERKFFSGRYYRQHCTFRHGAFIKDLSSVEPDLSKVMILDNSPLSYMFHQGQYSTHFSFSQPKFNIQEIKDVNNKTDNAIPIEGWINDPTDNDLLHLVPLLEGLQYATDVRSFLALRGGEDGKHTA